MQSLPEGSECYHLLKIREKGLWRRLLIPVVLSPDFTLPFSGQLKKNDRHRDFTHANLCLNLGPGHCYIFVFPWVIPGCFQGWKMTDSSSLSTYFPLFFQVDFLIEDGDVRMRQETNRKYLQEDQVNEMTSFHSFIPRTLRESTIFSAH